MTPSLVPSSQIIDDEAIQKALKDVEVDDILEDFLDDDLTSSRKRFSPSVSGWVREAVQQLDIPLPDPEEPKKRLRSDPEEIGRVATVLAVLLLDEASPNASIENTFRQLKQLKDEGRLQAPVGRMVVEKFDVALNNKYSRWKDSDNEIKNTQKKTALGRLRTIMEAIMEGIVR